MINPKIDWILSTAAIHNPTRFHENRLRTFCVILLTDGQTDIRTGQSQLHVHDTLGRGYCHCLAGGPYTTSCFLNFYLWKVTRRCPVLFCVYFDGLLLRLTNAGYGCYVGHMFAGVLAYTDDIVLRAPSDSAMRKMLSICDTFCWWVFRLNSMPNVWLYNLALHSCQQETWVLSLEGMRLK